MQRLEFVVPERPLSLQARDRANLQAWKAYVASVAGMLWTGAPIRTGVVRLTIVFMCPREFPIDVDNIIKPIQDALIDLVYTDDVLVVDVDSHRRYLTQLIDVTYLPRVLTELIAAGTEGVYVRVQNAKSLEECV